MLVNMKMRGGKAQKTARNAHPTNCAPLLVNARLYLLTTASAAGRFRLLAGMDARRGALWTGCPPGDPSSAIMDDRRAALGQDVPLAAFPSRGASGAQALARPRPREAEVISEVGRFTARGGAAPHTKHYRSQHHAPGNSAPSAKQNPPRHFHCSL